MRNPRRTHDTPWSTRRAARAVRHAMVLLSAAESSPGAPHSAVAGNARRLRTDCTGGIAITFALALPVLIGFAGLGTEAASWYVTKRAMQGAADSAASGAAAARATGNTGERITSEARSIAAAFSFVNGTGGTAVTVNNPPLSGGYAGHPNYVEVGISQPQTRRLSALFLLADPTISVRSVAYANLAAAREGCVLALNKTDITGLATSGTPALSLPTCALYVNASSASALNMNGSATITAGAAFVSGGINGSGLTTTDGTFTGTLPIPDPYASVPVPATSGCDRSSKLQLNAGETTTITPGSSGVYVFCNDVILNGGSTLNLSPGIYIIDGNNKSLTVQGNATLNALEGVTIIVTNRNGGDPATVKIASNANITVKAPTTGSTAGIAFFQDRQTCGGNASQCTSLFSGGATQRITGAIYFPENAVSYTGGSATGGAICTQLIADTIVFAGNSTFQNDCSSAGTKLVNATGGKLVQ